MGLSHPFPAQVRVSGLAGEAVARLDGSLDAVLEAIALAKRSRDVLVEAGAVTDGGGVVVDRAAFRARDRELDVVFRYEAEPTAALSPFVREALGIKGTGALVVEAEATYAIDAVDGAATKIAVARVAVNGNALSPPALYTWASRAAAAFGVANGIQERTPGPPRTTVFPRAPAVSAADAVATLRAADAHHALLAAALSGDGGASIAEWLDAAGAADGVVLRGLAGEPLARGRADVENALKAARALLRAGPAPATCAVDRVAIAADRRLTVRLSLRRRGAPDLVVVFAHALTDGKADAFAILEAKVEGVDVLPRRLADAVRAARDATDAQAALASLFRAFQPPPRSSSSSS